MQSKLTAQQGVVGLSKVTAQRCGAKQCEVTAKLGEARHGNGEARSCTAK